MSEKINPMTGLPIGQRSATIDTTTGTEQKVNPMTGKPIGSVARGNMGVSFGDSPDFTSSVMSTSDYNIRRKDGIDKYKAYDVPLGQDLDWDEIRARNQSTAEQWGRGLAKAGVTTLGAVAENTIGIGAGLVSLIQTGNYYDNAVGRTIDSANEWMRENYANYTTEAERNMSSLQKMGTANFWADTVANGIGYSLGSIATMYLTGGLGAVGMVGRITGASAKLASLYKASKAIATGAKLASTLGKGAKGARILKGAQMLDAALLMGLAESSVEARETKKGVLEDLKGAYLEKNGLEYEWQIPDDALEDIEKTANAAGNTNFVSNLAITTGTNALMFGKMALGFNAAKKASKDVIWDAISRKAKNKLADRSRWRKAIDIMKPIAENGLEEGLQEGLQFASNIYSTEYHIGKMHDGGVGDRAKALNKALSGTLGSQEGRESILVGLLTGMFMGTATSRGQAKQRAAAAESLTQVINSGYFDSVRSKVENENLSAITYQLMDKALKEGNIKVFKDLQNSLITAQGLNAIDQGGYEVMMQKLEDSKSLEDAEFAKMYGYSVLPAEGQSFSDISGGESKSQVVDNLKTKLEKVKKVHEKVNQRFPIPEKTKGLPRLLMSEEERMAEDKVYENQLALRNELIFKGFELSSKQSRQKSIIGEMQRLINEDPALEDSGINIASELQKIYKPADDFKFTEEDPDGSKTLEARDKNMKTALDNILKVVRNSGGDVASLTQLATDYLVLQGETRSAINAYNRLSSDPFYQQQFKDELDKAKKVMEQRRLNVEIDEAIANSKTAADLVANAPSKDRTNNAQKAKLRARYKELIAQQNSARQRFLDNIKSIVSLDDKLTALKNLKSDDLSDIERAGLADAIKDVQFAIDERDSAEGKSNEETASEMQDAGISEGEAGYLALEEASGLESLSEDGRMIKINGKVYYNHETNPDDAIERTKSGKIKKVRLVDAEGNRHTFYNTNSNFQADAIAYHIRLSQLATLSGQPTVNKETALREKRIADKLLAEEMERVSKAGKNGAKTTPSLRQEIYQLERLLEAALRAYDNLKQIYINEAGATKEDLKNDPELAELAKKLRSLRSQIGARRRVLKARGESTVATNQDIIRAENLARERIAKLRKNIVGFTTEEALNDQRLEEIEEALDKMKAAPRSEQLSVKFDERRRELLEEKRVITKINEEIDERIKELEAAIKVHQSKLKRIQDETSNSQRAGEEAGPTNAEETEGQDSSGAFSNSGSNSQRQRPVEGQIVNRAERIYDVKIGDKFYRVQLSGKRAGVVTFADTGEVVPPRNSEIIAKAMGLARQFEESYASEEESTPAPPNNDAAETEKEAKTGVQPSPPQSGMRVGLTKEEMADLGIEVPGMDMSDMGMPDTGQDPNQDPNQEPTDEFGAARDAAQQEGASADLNAAQTETRSVESVIAEIEENKEFIKLSEDGKTYVNTKTGQVYQRATQFISDKDIKDPIDPNESISEYKRRLILLGYSEKEVDKKLVLASSQIIGNKVDALVRDFFAGKLKDLSEYDVAPNNVISAFIKQLEKLKSQLDARGEKVIANDIVLYDDELGIAGTVDLLTYNSKGEFHIYDMKTMRGNNFTEYYYNDPETKYETTNWGKSKAQKWQEQLSLYRILLNNTHGIKAKKLGILPIELSMYEGGETSTKLLNLIEEAKTQVQVAAIKNILDESESVEDAIEKLLEGGHIVSFDGQGLVQIAPGDTAADPSRDAIYFKINGVVIPMYRSSKGTTDKKAGEWYPFFFRSESWVAKGLADNYKEGYGNPELNAIVDALNDNVQYSTPKATYKLDPIAGIRAVLPSLSEAEAQALYLGTYGEINSAMVDILQNWNSNIGKLDLSSAIEYLKAAKVSNPNGIGGEIESLEEEYAIFDKAIAKLEQMANDEDVIGEEGFLEIEPLDKVESGKGRKTASIRNETKAPNFEKEKEPVFPNRPAAVPPPRDPEPKGAASDLLGVRMANSNQEIGVQRIIDSNGQERYVIGTDSEGRRSTQYPDKNGEFLKPNTNLLIHSPVGTEVEFEIIEDSWFIETYGEDANVLDFVEDVPVYVKINDEIVGKLEASNSTDRRVIVEKLAAGEKVVSKIASKQVSASAYNHTRVTEGVNTPQVYFRKPSDVFDGESLQGFSEQSDSPIRLAAVSKALGGSSWITGDPALDGEIAETRDDDSYQNLASGQIGFVIGKEDSGDGTVKVIPASTANLSPEAQAKALKFIEEKDYDSAAEIVANSLADDSIGSSNYLTFGEFKDGTKHLIYKSPATGELVRINEHNMSKALNNKTPSYNFVKFDPFDQTFKTVNNDKLYDSMQRAGGVANDFKEFLKTKKYQVNPAAANINAPYTSLVTGIPYTSYQSYLFSPIEFDAPEGRYGYSSIVSTDISKVNGSIFNSPRVEFEKGGIISEPEETAGNQPPATSGGVMGMTNLSKEQIAEFIGEDFLPC